MEDQFYCRSDNYQNNPFDRLEFTYDFELSSVTLGSDIIRFDYYRTMKDEIIWRPRVDNLPELDICFPETQLRTINDSNQNCEFHPGFKFSIITVRDPLSKLIKYFLPCFILDFLVICVFYLEEGNLRIMNIGFILFNYVALIRAMKANIPEVPKYTQGDKFIYLQIVASLLPIV